jgi:hypothetical protein
VHELLPSKLAQALTIHLNFKIDILVDLQLPIELVIFHVGKLLAFFAFYFLRLQFKLLANSMLYINQPSKLYREYVEQVIVTLSCLCSFTYYVMSEVVRNQHFAVAYSNIMVSCTPVHTQLATRHTVADAACVSTCFLCYVACT